MRSHAPSDSERATALLIAGLVLAITTPFLVPTALGALWTGAALVRAGRARHAALVFAATAAALAIVVAAFITS